MLISISNSNINNNENNTQFFNRNSNLISDPYQNYLEKPILKGDQLLSLNYV
jgi:hypothetical protein